MQSLPLFASSISFVWPSFGLPPFAFRLFFVYFVYTLFLLGPPFSSLYTVSCVRSTPTVLLWYRPRYSKPQYMKNLGKGEGALSESYSAIIYLRFYVIFSCTNKYQRRYGVCYMKSLKTSTRPWVFACLTISRVGVSRTAIRVKFNH